MEYCIFRLLINRFSSAQIAFFLLANILVLGTIAYAFALDTRNPDFYYFSIQEDEYLEWSSFWAFLLAAVAYGRAPATKKLKTRPCAGFFLHAIHSFDVRFAPDSGR